MSDIVWLFFIVTNKTRTKMITSCIKTVVIQFQFETIIRSIYLLKHSWNSYMGSIVGVYRDSLTVCVTEKAMLQRYLFGRTVPKWFHINQQPSGIGHVLGHVVLLHVTLGYIKYFHRKTYSFELIELMSIWIVGFTGMKLLFCFSKRLPLLQ